MHARQFLELGSLVTQDPLACKEISCHGDPPYDSCPTIHTSQPNSGIPPWDEFGLVWIVGAAMAAQES